MGERNPTPSQKHGSKTKRMRAALALGTLAVLLGGGTFYLLVQPKPASAESESARKPRRATRAGTTSAAAQPRRVQPGSDQKPEFVARVNQERVSWRELADLCVARYGDEVLDDLINKRIIEQACEAQKIRVTSGEIDAEIAKQAKLFRVTTQQWLQMLEQERGLKPEQYAHDIVWPKLALQKLTKDQIKVTDEDLQKGFEANYGPRVKARMIVMSDQRKLTEVWAQAKKNPGNFGRLARDHSEDPGSSALDGQIQPIAKHSGFENLWKAAFELKPGELSGVIQIGERFAILLCEGHTEPVEVTMKEVRQGLHDDILERKTQAEINKFFQQLKQNAKIEISLKPNGPAGAPAAGTASAGPVNPTAKTAQGADPTRKR